MTARRSIRWLLVSLIWVSALAATMVMMLWPDNLRGWIAVGLLFLISASYWIGFEEGTENHRRKIGRPASGPADSASYRVIAGPVHAVSRRVVPVSPHDDCKTEEQCR